MRVIDDATFEEYVMWYLKRDFWKRGRADPPRIEDFDWCLREMYLEHLDRIKPEFSGAKWSRVVIDQLVEMESWVAPPFKWLNEEGLLPDNGDRHISTIADRVIEKKFFYGPRPNAMRAKSMYSYYRMLKDGLLRFSGINRLVLWHDKSKNETELFDGIARVLPMIVLARSGGRVIPTEAYYGE